MMTLEKLIKQSPGPVTLWADGETTLEGLPGEGDYRQWVEVEHPMWATVARFAGVPVNIQPGNVRNVVRLMEGTAAAAPLSYDEPDIFAIVWKRDRVNIVPLSIWLVDREKMERLTDDIATRADATTEWEDKQKIIWEIGKLELEEFPLWYQIWVDGRPRYALA